MQRRLIEAHPGILAPIESDRPVVPGLRPPHPAVRDRIVANRQRLIGVAGVDLQDGRRHDDPLGGAYYHGQRAKGCSHQAAVRALAYKWIRILYRCWQTCTPYDESVYLHALKRRGSPLIATLAATHQNP